MKPGTLLPRCLYLLVLPSALLRAQQTPAQTAPFAAVHRGGAPTNASAIYQDMRDRCPIARRADEAETAAARTYFSPRLTTALRNWDALWAFLNDSANPYTERIAAAYQGAPAVTPDALPRFAAVAAGRLKQQPQVQFSPCDVPSWIQLQTYITWPAYPVNDAQRANEPFDWQLQRMLDVLDREVKAYYDVPARNPALLRAMEAWQPTDTYEIAYRSEALLTGPRDIALLQRLVRETLAHSTIPRAPILRTLTPTNADTTAFLERLHVAQLVLLAQKQDASLAGDVATSVLRLANFVSQPEAKRVRSATSVLAIARWVQRQDLSPETRNALAKMFAPMIDRFPLHWDANAAPNERETLQMLATFDAWFASHRANLDEEAAAERPHLAGC